jgi:hypothetical protein
MSWKDALLISGAIVTGLFVYNRLVRRSLGPAAERGGHGRLLSASRSQLGPKAVAEAGKLATQGSVEYASKQEDAKTQKVG